jgi:hypothetical protein
LVSMLGPMVDESGIRERWLLVGDETPCVNPCSEVGLAVKRCALCPAGSLW